MFVVAASFCFGLAYSVLVTKLWRAVNRDQALRAAGLDLAIGILAAAPFQAWSMAGFAWPILAAEVVGGATGTYLGVRFGR